MPSNPSVDFVIGLHGGSTVAFEATAERVQASKKGPTPTPLQRIEQLSVDNGNLRHEISYLLRWHNAARALKQELEEEIMPALELALSKFSRALRQAESECAWTEGNDPEGSDKRHGKFWTPK